MTKISAVIPTKNRPDDLRVAVQSVYRQSRKPDQLVIIDQSENNLGRDAVESISMDSFGVELVYICDPSIPGLVAAKAASLNFSSGDLICFLEDDIVLEYDYIKEIESGFLKNEPMLGCSGIVTNPPKTSELYLFAFELFHRGIFYDCRPRIYASMNIKSDRMIESRALSGGLSAWRRAVFDHVKFDVENGFHMIEDFEFSMRASSLFGRRFFLNPKARLAHYFASSNRNALDLKYQKKVNEWILFYKKNRQIPFALVNLLWLMVGIGIETLVQSFRGRTTLPLRGYFRGLISGCRRPIIL